MATFKMSNIKLKNSNFAAFAKFKEGLKVAL
jgi:hypothetical protein